MNIIHEIRQINNIFSEKGSKLKIEKRGGKLNIRGALPLKENQHILKTQRISLGLNADSLGLEEAKKKLQLICLELELKQFNWENWTITQKVKERVPQNNLYQQVLDFEEYFFKESRNEFLSSTRKTTWRSSYKPYIKRLIKIYESFKKEELNSIFIRTLETYKKDSRSRKQCGTSLNVLAEFINHQLPTNWKDISKGYGLKKASFRDLPSDDFIEKLWYGIPNESWRFAFALMATYGLRNHEVFFCDLNSLKSNGDQIIRVLNTTKTGEHQVWPFHPKWVDLFGLHKLGENPKLLPKINCNLRETTLQNIGKKITDQFKRYGLQIRPYDLRHAWAVRTIFYDLPDSVSARMMGHSVHIHTQTYHHWITKRDQQKAVDSAILKFKEN